MTRYPRDMTGYGATPPAANWPGGAKIAVQIVLNYEEGGENNVLHGDAASEAFLSEITGAAAWPGQRHWNMESIYEYGSRAGFWRLHRMLGDLPVTVYGVATALARAPEQVAAMKAAGWEIASHGLKWVEHKDMPEAEERDQIAQAFALHAQVTGTPPRGWYTGRCSNNTVRLAAETGQLAYISDSYADDLPYWLTFGTGDAPRGGDEQRGGGEHRGDHAQRDGDEPRYGYVQRGGDEQPGRYEPRDQLIIPYTMDCNDMRFAIQAGFTTGDQFENYLKDTFDVLYEEGSAGQPKMMSIGLHCRLAGRPGRAAALRRAIEHFQSHDGVWFATRAEIADHWAKEHPPMPINRPSEMNRDTFVSEFGGIFEHSAWIADGAYDLELGPTHDTAAGVHQMLTRVFRSADENRRLGVLTAHPDLAGKLAEAKRLTAESTVEQASVGLNELTDPERQTFTGLNDAYTAKFGFPFIIAVRDNTKATIMAAFQRRVSQDRDSEFAEACRQVERIAELRLLEKFSS